MKLKARAKINLTLRVIGLREDGMHELESILQSVELADDVTIEPSDEASDSVSYRWPDGSDIPIDDDLVKSAAAVFRKHVPRTPVIRADVMKNIPVGAGLGGGSADAAAVVAALDETLGHPLSADALMMMAAEIGADVPFALQGGTASVKGVGERVSAMACPDAMWWVLVVPDDGLSTAEVYRHFDKVGEPSGPAPRVQMDTLVQALRTQNIAGVAEHLINDLESAAFDLRPELSEYKQSLIAAGVTAAVMTGSGSSMCGLCRDEAHAEEVASRLAVEGASLKVTTSSVRGAEILSMKA